MESDPTKLDTEKLDTEKPETPRISRIRFKSSKRRERSRSSGRSKRASSPSRDRRSHSRHDDDGRHRSSRRHHRTKRRKTTSSPSSSPRLDPRYDAGLDPDTAFRESLFDALADDEAADYWQSVYGQPIHIYGPPPSKAAQNGEKGENVNAMTDDEYAAYVRARMYEKTHEYVFEERKRRAAEREAQKKEGKRFEEETARMYSEREAFQKEIEASLRRSEKRKARKKWTDAWSRYHSNWEKLHSGGKTTDTSPEDKDKMPTEIKGQGSDLHEHGHNGEWDLGSILPWPVESGKQMHVNKENIERFLRHAPEDTGGLQTLLKAERVKWHPDKIQHRFGSKGNVDQETLKAVTAVFQVLDQMWIEIKDNNKKI